MRLNYRAASNSSCAWKARWAVRQPPLLDSSATPLHPSIVVGFCSPIAIHKAQFAIRKAQIRSTYRVIILSGVFGFSLKFNISPFLQKNGRPKIKEIFVVLENQH
jgi:hypothetical protein